MRAFLSLGGGVQSVALTVLSVLRDPRLLAVTAGNLPECAIFADTQRERKATYGYLWWFAGWCESRGFDIVTGTNGDIRADLMRAVKDGRRWDNFNAYTAGAPGSEAAEGRLFKTCSKHYKVEVVNRVIRERLGVSRVLSREPIVEKWIGISRDEWHRAKTSDVPWALRRDPLVDMGWHRSACVAYLQEQGVPVPPKSSCIECPEHGTAYWRDLVRESPEEFVEACDVDEAIRGGFNAAMPSPTGPLYLHRSLKPLKMIDFSESTGDLFGGCDDGGCFT